MTDLDREKELRPRERRRGILLSMLGALVGAVIVLGLLFRYAPWANQTTSDSANSNAGAIQGSGAGAQSGPVPTIPGQAAPASGTATR